MQMKVTDFFRSKTAHDFVAYRRIAVVASLIANLLVLFGAAVWPGLNYGVDFAGGTELQLHFKKTVDVSAVREEVGKAGFGEPTVQGYGPPSENQFLVRVERVALLTAEKANALHVALEKSFAKEQLTAFHFDPEVGDKLEVRFKQPVDESVLRAAVAA